MTSKSMIDISAIHKDVKELLGKDKSGHGMDHVDRVLKLAMTFAENERADKEIVTLATLLHDVDDYKIFGEEHAKKLLNANTILDKYNVADKTKSKVLNIIRSMGYNKYIEGVRPSTLEGMIVSDADMCDAIGSIGILRTHAYALSKGNVFFDKDVQPETELVDVTEYKTARKSHSVQHFFDKLLRIPAILMTDSGRREGEKRKMIMVSFLRELFQEEDSQEWQKYLNVYEDKS
ncbi:hypothetical protein A2791_03975 [Candidatus Saccharibacteria bacterium RIFCSPHIGHO2_01_FULL_46_30]|nr:MAG: hypothetical protein A2791_03975 [Candidatus Saccharibacteria bacterium RIFCSPHIGHO2_01_FULL_46_30]